MRNLLQLIVRYSNFLLLVGLEVVAFILVVHGNKYQQVALSGAANAVTASVHLMTDNVTSYFRLRSDNAQLLEENARLNAEIMRLYNDQTRQRLGNDTATTRQRVLGSPMSEAENGEYVQADLAYSFIPARVIAYSNDRHHNYITLNKGRRDGITPDMGVIGKDGIVGVVQSVSTHFAVVAPIIHEGIFISSMIRKNDYMATLHWHMPDIHTASLEDVARHVDVRVGDTIVTSGMSAIFPADMPVGVVSDVSLGEGDSYYDIDVRLATDFNSLRTVTVLQYAHRAELDSIR
ncbi:MAG: rod shape-determining protein MreC [Paludibacteraceae bacterium]|nr:rod shape-determining protein MreC [Paludibacteraceae bacterium]